MNSAHQQSTSGMKAVALLIGWISFAQLDPRAPFNLPETAYNAVVLVAAIAGVVAAISIWLNASWMIFAYGAWLVLTIIARIWHDAQIEPVVWKVALGGVILAVVFGLVGWFLHRDQSRTRV
jgi:hypothetical protein